MSYSRGNAQRLVLDLVEQTDMTTNILALVFLGSFTECIHAHDVSSWWSVLALVCRGVNGNSGLAADVEHCDCEVFHSPRPCCPSTFVLNLLARPS